MGPRFCILATHPIQYQAPWYRALASSPNIDLCVYFCRQASPQDQAHAGFGVAFDWDRPVLEGYPHRFLRNVAARPSLHRFRGLDTPGIADILARERYDAIIVSGWHYKSAWQAMWASLRTRTSLIVRGDSHLQTKRHPLKRAAKSLLYRQFLARVDACLAVGTWSKDYFLRYGVPDHKVFWVPHVIDRQWFTSERDRLYQQRAFIRSGWHLPSQATVFLFSGKFIEKKRPLDFVRALHSAIRRGASIAGLMVGDGPLRVQCEEYVRLHALPVTFAGFLNQSQIVQSYVAADALVLPSDGGETWGLVVNEAMECNLACIVSDRVGCSPDLIVDGETGSTFPMGNEDALSDLIYHYSFNLATLRKIGDNARTRVQEHSVETAVRGTLRAVESVACI